MEMNNTKPIVEMKDIIMSFSGNVVLNKVNFTLRKGEVHSLMGANGAGKSTLIKILNGIYLPKGGEIFINGEKAKINEPSDAEKYGLAFVHQELNVCPDLTVAENMYMGNWMHTKAGLYDKKGTSAKAQHLIDIMGIDLNSDTIVRHLRTAEKQIIEILKALTREAQIIILDEPTSSLNEKEKAKFFEIIDRLKSKGVSIIFISHFLEDVLSISDRVTVLKDGLNNGEFEKGKYTKDDLVEAMMGQKVDQIQFEPFDRGENCPIALKLNHLTSEGKFSDISLEIEKGDIVGVCGLLGAGKTEIARTIFGLDPYDSGDIEIFGKKMTKINPVKMINNKVVLLTEERKLEGFVPLLSIRENISVSIMSRFKKHLGLDYRKQNEFTQKLSQQVTVKMTGVEQSVESLSGGNQQKVVLAKCLASDPDVFLLDEPTRGVDILAKNEIYRILRNAAEAGTTIVIFSSEIEELLSNCSKIFVLKKGKMVDCVSSESVTKKDLLKMIG